MNIKLFPKETAANSVDPSFPTIKLSTIPVKVCPNIPRITGYANLILYENSLKYCDKFT